MTKQEAITIMFPNKSRTFLGEVWNDTVLAGSNIFNIIALDEKLIAEYGDYKGSMKDFVQKKFGQQVSDCIIK